MFFGTLYLCMMSRTTLGPYLIVFKYQGGFVHLPGGEKFEYLLAEFGVKVPTGELKLDGSPNPSSTWIDSGVPLRFNRETIAIFSRHHQHTYDTAAKHGLTSRFIDTSRA